MEKTEQLIADPRRHVLHMTVASVLNNIGFASADKQCVETLTEV